MMMTKNKLMRRVAGAALVASLGAVGAATPASAATPGMPIPIADPNSNITLCASPGPCHPATKYYDRHGDLRLLCTTVCYRALAMRFPGQHGWYVYLVGGGRAGPMPKRP